MAKSKEMETTEQEAQDEDCTPDTPPTPTDDERLKTLLATYRAGGGNSAASKEALGQLLELVLKKILGE